MSVVPQSDSSAHAGSCPDAQLLLTDVAVPDYEAPSEADRAWYAAVLADEGPEPPLPDSYWDGLTWDRLTDGRLTDDDVHRHGVD